MTATLTASTPAFAGDRTRWKEWDHAYVWHPFTQMREWLSEEPLNFHIERETIGTRDAGLRPELSLPKR